MTNSTKELKIIITLDDNNQIKPSNVIFTIGDETVGCIQDLKFHASVDEPICNLEVTFPDLKSPYIDQKAYQEKPNLINTVERFVEKLNNILGVHIILKDIFKT